MTPAEKQIDTILDDEGKVIPTQEATDFIERQFASQTPAARYRLAQAQTLLNFAKEYKAHGQSL